MPDDEKQFVPAANNTAISLNGGVYPNEDGSWRVCVWFSGFGTEAHAKQVSDWLAKLVQANITPAAQPSALDT